MRQSHICLWNSVCRHWYTDRQTTIRCCLCPIGPRTCFSTWLSSEELSVSSHLIASLMVTSRSEPKVHLGFLSRVKYHSKSVVHRHHPIHHKNQVHGHPAASCPVHHRLLAHYLRDLPCLCRVKIHLVVVIFLNFRLSSTVSSNHHGVRPVLPPLHPLIHH